MSFCHFLKTFLLAFEWTEGLKAEASLLFQKFAECLNTLATFPPPPAFTLLFVCLFMAKGI